MPRRKASTQITKIATIITVSSDPAADFLIEGPAIHGIARLVNLFGKNTGRHDLIIMAITSQVRQPLGFGEALVADWQVSGLIKPSVLKHVVTSIEQALVVRTLGAFSATDLHTLQESIAQVIG